MAPWTSLLGCCSLAISLQVACVLASSSSVPTEHSVATHGNGKSSSTSTSTHSSLNKPGSVKIPTKQVSFNSYWVPAGAISVDDTDTHILYTPTKDWNIAHSTNYIDSTIHVTASPAAVASFSFEGTGLEWYGSTSSQHGKAQIWLDGQLVRTADLYSKKPEYHQLLFYVDHLPEARHIFKIVATGTHSKHAENSLVDIDAFVVHGRKLSNNKRHDSIIKKKLESRQSNTKMCPKKRSVTPTQNWTLAQTGTTGVSAMQMAVVDDTHVVIIDKVEHNPLTVNGHPAWGSVFDLTTHTARPLNLLSDSFCAGGSFLGNGTLINVGGNPTTDGATIPNLDGLQGIRLFTPCPGDNCDIYENPQRIRMASPRWYASVARLHDGSAFIIGGSLMGLFENNATANNPTIEYFPPKNLHGSNGLTIPSPFLLKTLNANLFPIVFYLPNNKLFIAANQNAMLYDWEANTEQQLPDIPNGVRITYPMTAGSAMLPLTKENGYTPEILICGGSTVSDTVGPRDIDSQDPASAQCVRMVLDAAGIAGGWLVEQMPQARIMPDLIVMPDGNVLIVNGGETGIAGYGNIVHQIGQSNADHPVFTPVLYTPTAPIGKRFSSNRMPTSDIARLYHSSATLIPSGEILIAGSNPNADRSTVKYPTEYRAETLSPPYISQTRPSYSGLPKNLLYAKNFELSVTLPAGLTVEDLSVSLIDLGFVTHSVHMNSRLVELEIVSLSADGKTLVITAPPSAMIYPPGPAWLYLLADSIPSIGLTVLVGDGSGPPVDEAAIANLLANTGMPKPVTKAEKRKAVVAY